MAFQVCKTTLLNDGGDLRYELSFGERAEATFWMIRSEKVGVGWGRIDVEVPP
jgi:hypothetical protein